jgi:hypothetical protein
MQDKRKINKVNNKEEMGIGENINKPIEQDKKKTGKEDFSISMKERNAKRASNAQKKVTS